MRFAFFALLIATLACTSALAREARSPCDVFSKAELAAVLGGKPIAPDPATIGEETAPSCIWTVRGAKARLKIEIWSGDALLVVGERTAHDYFDMRRREALKFDGAELVYVGERAYRSAFDESGEIGVLKDRRFIVFSFDNIRYRRALAFAKTVIRRL